MVSAVILAYNRCNEVLITIGKLLVYRNDLPFEMEIIVVDNASADNTSAKIREQFPEVKLVTKPANNGIAGWNEGFKVAKFDYILVLDDDSHVHNGLQIAVERMKARPEVGIIAMQIKDAELQTDPFLDPEKAWKDRDEIAGFIGCGALIRKELYKKIGGFAEWIYVYTHEFEYAIRCMDAGYKLEFCAGCVVIHRVSNINRSNKRLRIFATRNELLIVHKYFKDNKMKYLKRVLVNNLKFIKREGITTGYYVMSGYVKYLQMKSKLQVTPVSEKTQEFFACNFWSTKPIFSDKK